MVYVKRLQRARRSHAQMRAVIDDHIKAVWCVLGSEMGEKCGVRVVAGDYVHPRAKVN